MHANAHGISIPEKLIPHFLSYANNALSTFDFSEAYYDVDFQRDAFDADLTSLISDLDTAAGCWATLNPEPVLNIAHINVKKSDISVIGKNKDTIRWTTNGVTYVVFSAKDRMDEFFNNGDYLTIEVVGKANINLWGGKSSAQILVSNFEVKPMSFEF